ncbi:MAG TPA: AAA family ATPase [Novosphingobium sp.]|nr:AAA family ATPase [Novosphingobium sp.]
MPQALADQSETIALLERELAVGGQGESGKPLRIDTHGAILLLGRERVLKLKRAVDLGYLDFSTPARRLAACQAEVRLNRRTAPEMYVGLRAVLRGGDGALRLGPIVGPDSAGGQSADALDHVVEMRRFPAEGLLSEVAARGELTPGLVRDLADGIARFHAGAAISGDAQGAARMRAVIEGNARSLAALPEGVWPKGAAQALTSASLEECARIADVLDARARGGWVRHCHGDLHLANICLWHGRPTLFDCLEFNAQLATTDVLYDLAFLLMDLWHHGHQAQASQLLNRYADMGEGADTGLAALPLFLSVRAAIRAHVGASAALLATGAARAEGLEKARALLASAQAFLARPGVRLVAVGGLSGSGKSTLAGALAPHLGVAPGARWLRSDVIRKRLAGIAPEQRLPADSYTPEASAQVYAALVERCGAVLAAGWPVVADAVFARPDERAAIADAAQGVRFDGLWLDAGGDVLTARVGARRGDASDADAAVVRHQQAYAIGDLGAWRRIDASGTPVQVLDAALPLLAG